MEEKQIQEAIEYLQSLNQQNTKIDYFNITYGTTTARSSFGEIDFFERVYDGSFFLKIRGKEFINK